MRCFLLLKFAKLDSSDRKVLDIFRNEMKKNKELLTKDLEQTKRKRDGINSKIIMVPYMNLGSKVY